MSWFEELWRNHGVIAYEAGVFAFADYLRDILSRESKMEDKLTSWESHMLRSMVSLTFGVGEKKNKGDAQIVSCHISNLYDAGMGITMAILTGECRQCGLGTSCPLQKGFPCGAGKKLPGGKQRCQGEERSVHECMVANPWNSQPEGHSGASEASGGYRTAHNGSWQLDHLHPSSATPCDPRPTPSGGHSHSF